MNRTLLESSVSLLTPDVVERMGWLLVHSLWQFALVVAVANVLNRSMCRSSASARCWMLASLMILMISAPIATWFIARDGESHRDTSPLQLSLARHASSPPFPHEIHFPRPDSASRERITEKSDAVVKGTVRPGEADIRVPVKASSWFWIVSILQSWLSTIVVAWSFGVLAFSLRPVLSWRVVRRLKSVGVTAVDESVNRSLAKLKQTLAVRRSVEVLQSTLVCAPVVAGCFRSVILLPVSLMANLPPSQLEAILAHELAHVGRYDYLINVLQTLVETLFFYHPAVWWLSNRIRTEREHCCDDLVVAALGDRVQYGRALLAIEEYRGAASLLVLGARDGSLLSCVRRLAGNSAEQSQLRGGGLWGLSFVGLAMTGLLWAMTSRLAATIVPVVVTEQADEVSAIAPELTTIRGRVLNEDDVPAGEAIIEAQAEDGKMFATTANSVGRFELQLPKTIKNLVMTIRDKSDTMMWVGDLFPGGPRVYGNVPQGEQVTVILSPMIRSELLVVDDAGRSVSAATVVVQSQTDLISVLRTDEAGRVIVRLPQFTIAQAHGSPRIGGNSVPMIMAFKARVGYDYFSAVVRDENNYPVKNPPKLPERLKLTLNGAITVRLKAVDTQGQPMAGVTIRPWYVAMEGNPGYTNFHSNPFSQVTNRDGIAVFDWFPPTLKQGVTFWAKADDFDADRVDIKWEEHDDSRNYEIKLKHRTKLSGHVVDPKGQPVEGAVVNAHSQAAGSSSSGTATTDADGKFSMMVASKKAYVAHVRHGDMVGYHVQIMVRENEPVTDVEIRLVKGTVIRGTVTRGTPPVPVKEQGVSLALELGGLHDAAITDENGAFRFIAAPGDYVLYGPRQAEPHNLTVTDEEELEFNFHVPHKELDQLTGHVRDPDGQPLSEAKIHGVYEGRTHSRQTFSGKSDAEGSFDIERETQPAMVHIVSADQTLGAIVSIDGDDEQLDIDLKPTYSARGRLVKGSGNALTDAKVTFSVKVYQGEKGNGEWVRPFGGSAKSDADGNYVLEHLVQGIEYDILLEYSAHGPWSRIATVKHDSAEDLELGDERK